MILMYIAHIIDNRIQLLKDHLKEVAELSMDFAKDFNVERLSYIIGLLHDVGKYSENFQKRIKGSNVRVDHSTAGAQLSNELFKQAGGLFSTIISYCIMGHHAGLPNMGSDIDSNESSTLKGRLKKAIDDYSSYKKYIDIKNLSIDNNEVKQILMNSRDIPDFSLSFLIRMLFSCLVDADYLDTERFMSPNTQRAQGYDFIGMNTCLTQKLKSFNSNSSLINEKRKEILDKCLERANDPKGIFTLSVPTGGGKTLSSMAFALKHLLKHNQKRIIYVIPYSSIIEQNAKVFKRIFGEESVLEHHYNYEYDYDENFELSSEQQKMKLATQNWDMPIIVTTNVQFFESLFSHKSSQCRKLHNIANSVIIFDEVQMFPYDFLKPCLIAIRELVKNYNSSVVFCSATQPDFKKYINDIMFTEIIPNPSELHRFFKRVEVKKIGTTSNEKISALMKDKKQVLTIVNERRTALKVFDFIKDEENSFCLSTLQTPSDRKANIEKIKKYLNDGKACKVISTQLIEAGVDIDFPIVYRELSGIDSIIQAAGRCNREGKIEIGRVKVFLTEKNRPRRKFNHLDQAESIAKIIFDKFDDITSIEAVGEYFEHIYSISSLDIHNIMRMFITRENECRMVYNYREASEKFKLIDNIHKAIIIRNKESSKLIECLRFVKFPNRVFNQLQQHTVMVYPYELEKLKNDYKVSEIAEDVYALDDNSIYDDKLGLNVFYDNLRDVLMR